MFGQHFDVLVSCDFMQSMSFKLAENKLSYEYIFFTRVLNILLIQHTQLVMKLAFKVRVRVRRLCYVIHEGLFAN